MYTHILGKNLLKDTFHIELNTNHLSRTENDQSEEKDLLVLGRKNYIN